MTTTTTTTAERDDDEAWAVQYLREPRDLLVDALLRIRQADTIMLEDGGGTVDALEQSLYRVESAKAVAAISTAAADLAERERNNYELTMYTGEDGPETDVEPAASTMHTEGPVPIQGVRFTAHLVGRKLGVIGNQPWLWMRGVGFLNGADGLFTGCWTDDDGTHLQLHGRVVSSTPEQALCVTDGGVAVALPHSAIEPVNEEDR